VRLEERREEVGDQQQEAEEEREEDDRRPAIREERVRDAANRVVVRDGTGFLVDCAVGLDSQLLLPPLVSMR